MKKLILIASAAILTALTATSVKATDISLWTFETSLPLATDSATLTGVTAEGGVSPGTASGVHASALTDYSNPAGNGSAESFSANNWAVGDYYQFQVSTIGFTGIGVSYDQISSSTGPGQFNFQYSTDGSLFTTVGSTYSVLVNAAPDLWSSGIPVTTTSFFYDLSTVTALNNQAAVYFRLTDASTVAANGGPVATTGTDRVDNFLVMTPPVNPVPEPSTVVLASLGGLVALMAIRRRR